MADLKTLSGEMEKLQRQIKTVLYIAQYPEYDDLSGLDDFNQIRTPDQRQQLEEYRSILDKLDDIQRTLAYYDRPIIEVSKIYKNESGRFETDKGHYFTSGSGIEFLRTTDFYNDDSCEWEKVEVWTTSRVESKNGQYYIVGYSDLEMSGLKVRIRG